VNVVASAPQRQVRNRAELASPIVSDMAIVFTILGTAVVLFAWNRLPVEVVAIGVAM